MRSLQSTAYIRDGGARERFDGQQGERDKEALRVCFSHVISHLEEETVLDKKENDTAGSTKKDVSTENGQNN